MRRLQVVLTRRQFPPCVPVAQGNQPSLQPGVGVDSLSGALLPRALRRVWPGRRPFRECNVMCEDFGMARRQAEYERGLMERAPVVGTTAPQSRVILTQMYAEHVAREVIAGYGRLLHLEWVQDALCRVRVEWPGGLGGSVFELPPLEPADTFAEWADAVRYVVSERKRLMREAPWGPAERKRNELAEVLWTVS